MPATIRKKRPAATSKAEHFSKHHIAVPGAGIVTIYVAQDSGGLYYASPAVEWDEPDQQLRNLASHLLPAAGRKFSDAADAAWQAVCEARDYLERLRLDRLTSTQLKRLIMLDDALLQEHDGCRQPSAKIDLATELPAIEWEEAKVECDLIDRHPQNREVPIPSVADLAESIKRTGRVLERVKLRDLGDGRYQMLSGERRWKAVHLILGWETIDADVATMSDAAARALLTICNTQRQDLNDIEKATDLQQLCLPAASGGAGMTEEAAGELYGISVSHVKNLIRLLAAPEPLRALVISRELPSSFLRAALPYLAIKGMEKVIVKEVREWHKKPDEPSQPASDRVPSREEFVMGLRRQSFKMTRSMKQVSLKDCYSEWSIEHANDRLFSPSPEQLDNLMVITVDGFHGKEERATNTKLWDQLQKAAIPDAIAKLKAKRNGKAHRAAGDDTTAAKAETPAERKKREARNCEQLNKRIAGWSHRWRRRLIAERLEQHPDVVNDVTLWLMGQSDLARDTEQQVAKMFGCNQLWQAIRAARSSTVSRADIDRDLARAILTRDDRDWRFPRIPHDVIDDLSELAGLDITAEWRRLQQERAVEYEEFLNLHDRTQLDALAAELKVDTQGASTKKQLVARLNSRARCLQLPKSLAGLAVAKKVRGKK